MKKISLQLLTYGVSTLLLLGCGGGRNSGSQIAKVRPEKIEISGDLFGFLEVVDNEYEIIDDMGGKLTIKVKAIKTLPENHLNGSIKISASILGENGAPISGAGEFEIFESSKEKLVSVLKKGDGEEVIELGSDITQYDGAKHASKSKKFVVSSVLTKTNEFGSSSSSADDQNIGIYYAANDKVYFYNTSDITSKRNAFVLKNEELQISIIENGFGYTEFTSTQNLTSKGWLRMSELTQEQGVVNVSEPDNSFSKTEDEAATDIQYSSSDCDKFIKDYEAFINSYIKLIKKYKANPTEVAILSEYTEAVEKANALDNNVALCSDTRYATKLLELQAKLAKVAL